MVEYIHAKWLLFVYATFVQTHDVHVCAEHDSIAYPFFHVAKSFTEQVTYFSFFLRLCCTNVRMYSVGPYNSLNFRFILTMAKPCKIHTLYNNKNTFSSPYCIFYTYIFHYFIMTREINAAV